MNAKDALAPKPFIWLMLAIVLTALPHFLRFPLPLSAFVLGALGLKLFFLSRSQLQFNRILLLLMMLTATVIVVLFYGTISGHEAGSALLVGMLSLKLLESKTQRDAMVCVFLAYFLAAINFLFTQSIPTAIWMLIQVVLITFCLISVSQYRLNLPMKTRLWLSAKTVVMALPVMLILFVLFPRIPGPLWGIPKNSQDSQTGFSDTMSPGKFSNLAQSSAVAFRAKFEGNDIPKQADLYWRALVLTEYDGFTWTKGIRNQAQPAPSMASLNLPEIAYTVTLEPHQKHALFTLDMPTRFTKAESLNTALELRSKDPVNQVWQYSAHSVLSPRIPVQLTKTQRRLNLALPEGFNPQTVQLGKQWRLEYGNDQAIVQAALRKFNGEAFTYTLQPPPLGVHKVDDFMFRTQKGFCEYYSNAFVVLMRAAGIPARVVVGYQGGEINPVNNNLTIRQSDAHAWAEVWTPNTGWLRIDPTASVSPDRVEESLAAALPLSDAVPLLSRPTSSIKRLVNLWDAVDNGWNQWILGYGPKLQQQFLKHFGLSNFMHFTYAMMALVGGFLAILLYFMLRTKRLKPKSEAHRIFLNWQRRMQRYGYRAHPHQSATEYVRWMSEHLPEQRQTLQSIARRYNQLRYDDVDKSTLTVFKQVTKQFKPVKHLK